MNLIFINCHDLGQHLNCYGVATVHSPNLDRLAASGVRFRRSFCVAPQCSPSRATMFTGRYPHCNGVMGLAHGLFAWDLNPDERHLATILRDAGYATALVGFIHETWHPEKLGFDEILRSREGPLGERAGEMVRRLAKGGKPFYLQVGFFEPHRTLDATGKDENGYGCAADDSLGVTVPAYLVDEPSARRDFAGFQGAIRFMDEQLGIILRALEESGAEGETMVVFTTDHGIPFPRAKCSLFDAGLEVALMMRVPRCGGGRVSEAMVSNLDYVPTLLELMGLPAEGRVQGESFAGVVRGEKAGHRREFFAEMTYHGYYDPRRCVRTERHKLILNFSNAPFFQDPSQQWRPKTLTFDPPNPAYAYHPVVELYDLAADAGERVNLAGQEAHAGVERELLAKLSQWMRETNDPLLGGPPVSPMHTMAMSRLV